ncbi:hypothetical protein H5410_019205, partial [Solanum commersonii]
MSGEKIAGLVINRRCASLFRYPVVDICIYFEVKEKEFQDEIISKFTFGWNHSLMNHDDGSRYGLD